MYDGPAELTIQSNLQQVRYAGCVGLPAGSNAFAAAEGHGFGSHETFTAAARYTCSPPPTTGFDVVFGVRNVYFCGSRDHD
jgi:hypothetical protein